MLMLPGFHFGHKLFCSSPIAESGDLKLLSVIVLSPPNPHFCTWRRNATTQLLIELIHVRAPSMIRELGASVGQSIARLRVLFIAQSHHRINPHRTPSREVTGDQCDQHQHDCNHGESKRILRPDPEQLVRHEARQS